MIDPPRLLSTSSDELELAVIRSARLDAPPARSLRGIAAALSVGPAALAAAAKPAAAATGAAAVAPALSAVQSVLTASGLLKPFFAGVLGGVLTVGATAGVRHVLRTSEPAPVAVQKPAGGAPAEVVARAPAVGATGAAKPVEPEQAAAAVPVATAVLQGAPARVAAVRATSAAEPEAARRSGEAVAAAPPAPVAAFDPEPVAPVPAEVDVRPSPSIAAEIALVERARVALGQGNSRAALVFLDEYSARSPSNALAPEATLLRIQALDAAGDRAAAVALAGEFVVRFPQSRHVPALTKFIDGR